MTSGNDHPPARAARQRPGGRATRVRTAVTEAAFAILEEVGYDELTLPDVATRAGVNKTTVYRRWPTKADLVSDLFIALAASQAATPDTGSLQTDLELLLAEAVSLLKTNAVRSVLRASITAAQSDEGVSQARAQFWADRAARSGAIIHRAIERGELPLETDPKRLLDVVFGPVYLRLVIYGEELEPDYLKDLAALGANANEFTKSTHRADPAT